MLPSVLPPCRTRTAGIFSTWLSAVGHAPHRVLFNPQGSYADGKEVAP
jgi:hypothetical protein